MSNEKFAEVGVNIQEKATVIWNITNALFGYFKPYEYGLVVLPMTVVKRFHDCLLPIHTAVQEQYAKVKNLAVIDGFLTRVSGYQFYNTSRFTFDLLLSDADLSHRGNVTVYDMVMGTSQMLSCMEESIHDLNQEIEVTCFGQEFNPATYAIAKADMMIRGGDPNNMRFGDTLLDDQFKGFTFQYCIFNPPFSIAWKRERKVSESMRKIIGALEIGHVIWYSKLCKCLIV